MLFSSPFFIFIFLPAFLSLFLISGFRFRDYVLLLASVGFYFWGEPLFCLIAIASACLDYWLCQKIFQHGVKTLKAKRYLIVGILANVSLLIYYKYTNFFIDSINKISANKFHFELFDIILPIGVSFIVFEKITYIVDVYRGVGKPATSILKYINYVFLFPKLLAGPIIKYHEIEQQLNQRLFSADDFAEGFKRFLRGLIKKVLFADTCGNIANQVFALSGHDMGCSYAWIGVITFTLQIYFDFSGYSDMALGLARMLGFKLKENFNMPYIATSFTDFWRRWHISLSTWIREYLYIPLGGNQGSQVRVYTNLWICFLLSGLWHGANWTFVLWGAYNGLFLVLDKLFWLKASTKVPHMIRVAITLFLVMLGWVIFRCSDFTQVGQFFATLFTFGKPNHANFDITPDVITAIVLGSVVALAGVLPGFEKAKNLYLAWKGKTSFEGMLYGLLGLFAICKVVGVSFNPFLYFRF